MSGASPQRAGAHWRAGVHRNSVGQLPELVRTAPFIGAGTDLEQADLILFGCPFDSTCSFRAGARHGPAAIRAVSDVLETYCPVLKDDLGDVCFADAGDLLLPPGDPKIAVDRAYEMAVHVHASGQIPAGLGGEHLMSWPLIRAAAEAHRSLVVVHFDAHLDLRNEYLGVQFSHATVMRRVSESVEPSRILHIASRSGTREEFEQVELLGNLKPPTISAGEITQWVGDRPLYATVDLDVLDPSVIPGTGTPEPGGVAFTTLQDWLAGLSGCRWVGWDVMELSPDHDPTQVSSIVSAKIVRTMILASTAGRRGRVAIRHVN